MKSPVIIGRIDALMSGPPSFHPAAIKTGKAEPKVAAWAERIPALSLFLSVITLLELETDLIERRNPSQGLILRRWLRGKTDMATIPFNKPYMIRISTLGRFSRWRCPFALGTCSAKNIGLNSRIF